MSPCVERLDKSKGGCGCISTFLKEQLYKCIQYHFEPCATWDPSCRRHPLTGGGMTVALSDTKLLCDMLQPLPDFRDSIATANQTAEFYTKRKPLSATINTLANALYKVSPSH